MNKIVLKKLKKFFKDYPLESIDEGEILITPKHLSDYVYFLESGRVIQYANSPHNNRVIVNIYKPGSFFPISLVLHGVVDKYYFETHEDCRFRKAPRAEMINFLRTDPDVLFDLLRRLTCGLDGYQQRLVYMASENADKRLAFELYISVKRFGVQGSDGSYEIPLTEVDIAALAGLTRETINREISRLKKQNIVSVDRKKIIIHDLDKITEFLDK